MVSRVGKFCFWAWLAVGVVEGTMMSNGPEVPSGLRLLGYFFFCGIFSSLLYDWSRSRSSQEDKALFLLEFSDLTRLGVPAPEALQKLVALRSKSYGHRFAELTVALREVSEEVSRGMPLSDALQQNSYFPSHWALFIRHCDNEDELADALQDMSAATLRTARLPYLSLLRIQIMLPLVIGIGAFLTTYIMPTFVELFKGMSLHLPQTTRVFLSMWSLSNAMKLQWVLSLLCLVLILAVPFVGIRRILWKLFYRIPGVSQMIALDHQARIYHVLGAGLKHRADLDSCLKGALDACYVGSYKAALSEVEGGDTESLPSLFSRAPNLFFPKYLWLLRQGEELENLPEALLTAAELAQTEAEQRARKAATNLDTAVLVAIGLAVGLVAVAVFQPLYLLIGNMG